MRGAVRSMCLRQPTRATCAHTRMHTQQAPSAHKSVHTHALPIGAHWSHAHTSGLQPMHAPTVHARDQKSCMHDRSTRSRLSVWMEASVLSSFRNLIPAGPPGWAYNSATCPSPLSPLAGCAPPPPNGQRAVCSPHATPVGVAVVLTSPLRPRASAACVRACKGGGGRHTSVLKMFPSAQA
jgi:hypothetical protein